ncbi:hypothetical protein Q5P01_010393 [Channa striata]|uniref:Uncharacterized protein n=1 Tax=Channa striata TaxID=64152 RepID=A0AA88MXQ3_CHASR|nr:hypothetical protein Q5P01_010393 [Channa striata]
MMERFNYELYWNSASYLPAGVGPVAMRNPNLRPSYWFVRLGRPSLKAPVRKEVGSWFQFQVLFVKLGRPSLFLLVQFLLVQLVRRQFLLVQFLLVQFLLVQFLLVQFLLVQFLLVQFLLVQFLFSRGRQLADRAEHLGLKVPPLAEVVSQQS